MCLRRGGGGIPEFFGVVKGGKSFFFCQWAKRGRAHFFTYGKGGPEKIGDRTSRADGHPPAKK